VASALRLCRDPCICTLLSCITFILPIKAYGVGAKSTDGGSTVCADGMHRRLQNAVSGLVLEALDVGCGNAIERRRVHLIKKWCGVNTKFRRPLHSSRRHNDRLKALDARSVHVRHSKDVENCIFAVIVLRVRVEVVGIIQPAEVPVHVIIERLHKSREILCLL
jgi:hypothetical protein